MNANASERPWKAGKWLYGYTYILRERMQKMVGITTRGIRRHRRYRRVYFIVGVGETQLEIEDTKLSYL